MLSSGIYIFCAKERYVEGGVGSDPKMKKGELIRRHFINLKGGKTRTYLVDLEILLEGRTRRLQILQINIPDFFTYI